MEGRCERQGHLIRFTLPPNGVREVARAGEDPVRRNVLAREDHQGLREHGATYRRGASAGPLIPSSLGHDIPVASRNVAGSPEVSRKANRLQIVDPDSILVRSEGRGVGVL